MKTLSHRFKEFESIFFESLKFQKPILSGKREFLNELSKDIHLTAGVLTAVTLIIEQQKLTASAPAGQQTKANTEKDTQKTNGKCHTQNN